jgi:pilus assembly protein Flp/PilA
MSDLLLRTWCASVIRWHEIKEGERGATAVEYGIMIALIAAVIIVLVKVVGQKTSNAFSTVNQEMP